MEENRSQPTNQQQGQEVQPQESVGFADQQSAQDWYDDGAQQYVLPGQPDPEYLIVDWEADSRVVRPRTKQYYSSLAVIVMLFSLILFFANQILLIFVLWAFLFVSYVLASVKAEPVRHQITTYGVRYRGQLYYWEQCRRYWIVWNHGIPEVHIEIPNMFLNEIILLPSNAQSAAQIGVEDLVDIFSRYLPYEEPLPSQLDKWVRWLQEKFPLETPEEETATNLENSQTADEQKPQR